MKRTIAATLVAAGMLGSMAGPAAARGPRVREDVQEYSLPRAVGAETDYPGALLGVTSFEPLAAQAVSFVIEDAASPAVFAQIVQDDRVVATFCSATDAPVRIAAGVTVEVELFAAPCGDGAGVPTTGVVRATFTRIGGAR